MTLLSGALDDCAISVRKEYFPPSLQNGAETQKKVARILSLTSPVDQLLYKQRVAQQDRWTVIDSLHTELEEFQWIHDFFKLKERSAKEGVNPFFFSRENVPKDVWGRNGYFSQKVAKWKEILKAYEQADKQGKKKIMAMYPIEKLVPIGDTSSASNLARPIIEDSRKCWGLLKRFRKWWEAVALSERGGAENQNRIFLSAYVLKTTTKERHGDDYYSMLQLMINMLRVERDFNGLLQPPDEDKNISVEVKTATEAFAFTKDNDTWLYHRDIIQNFAGGKDILEWREVDDVLKSEYRTRYNVEHPSSNYKEQLTPENFKKGCEDRIPLFIAYKQFLAYVRWRSKGDDGYLLDVADSRQWLVPSRGNVLSTSNVVVKKEWNRYIFTVIDPDVFNTDGRHKFSAKEKLLSRGVKPAVNMIVTNRARIVVKRNMESYMNEILDWEDHTISLRRMVH